MNWLSHHEPIPAQVDKTTFIEKAFLSMLGITARIRRFSKNKTGIYNVNAGIKILFTVFNVILISCSQSLYFILLEASYAIALLLMCDDSDLLQILTISASTAGFSALIIFPSYFFGNASALFLVCKIGITILLMMIMAFTTNWHEITSACGQLRVPDLIVFIFDSTIRYIYLLAERSRNITEACLKRSTGILHKPQKTAGDILSNLFITSNQMNKELSHAMECRCFDGKFIHQKSKKLIKNDYFFLLPSFVIFVFFLLLNK